MCVGGLPTCCQDRCHDAFRRHLEEVGFRGLGSGELVFALRSMKTNPNEIRSVMNTDILSSCALTSPFDCFVACLLATNH